MCYLTSGEFIIIHQFCHRINRVNYPNLGEITRIGVLQGQILCISPNGLQAGHCDAPPPLPRDNVCSQLAYLQG